MTVKLHHIATAKTARYAISGNDITKAKRIWFACHGYGQLAPYFIRKFEPLDPAENFVIAPEGMNRFYLEGFSGRVGATWMTKEDRLTDIKDYIAYLNQLHEALGLDHLHKDQQLIHFGFSQGVATISRYITMGAYKPHKAVFWSGTFPPDLHVQETTSAFRSIEVHTLLGDRDPFASPDRQEVEASHFQGLGIHPIHHAFEGGHDILPQPLIQLAAIL